MSGFTEDALNKLEAAIAQGVRIVKYADRTVEYQTTSDMLKARDIIKREITGQAGPAKRRAYASTSKGFRGCL